MTAVRNGVLVLALLASAATAASDTEVYESFDGVRIGRVFLSQQHRDALDKKRLLAPADRLPVADSSSSATAKPGVPPAAGYIIGPNGRPKTWRNGDFVSSQADTARRMSFPGDVKVTRHEPESTVKDDEPD